MTAPAWTARPRRVRVVGPDSANLVDLYIDGKLAAPALTITDLRDIANALTDVIVNHPSRDLTPGPDGRLYCATCTEAHRADECERHDEGSHGCKCPCGGPKLCAERCGLAPEPGDIYCDGCRSGIEAARMAGAR